MASEHPHAVERILPQTPIERLRDYADIGGGRGIEMARKLGPAAVIEEVEASGLRGRGGAGFPTGKKWRTVADYASPDVPSTVVVNGAEGEPGTFKDRMLMRRNPYGIVEGAVIAALAVGADRAVIAIRTSFEEERRALERAVDEATEAGWTEDVALAVALGPEEYLVGEETALLEVLDGRPPFPRIAPPFRDGVDEVVTRPPTLVNNVETIANIGPLLAEGAQWFREVGTDTSPGTVVCTVSGATQRAGVAELAMGTPLREAIARIGIGPLPGARFVAAMSGVANPLIPEANFDTPLTYDDMQSIGSGLGAAGFLVFDDNTDMAAVAAGVSRFLAVESCGQCTPCKEDGLAIAGLLERVCAGNGTELDLVAVADHVRTVSTEARCFLAQQHERVLDSFQRLFPDELRRHVAPDAEPAAPFAVAAIKRFIDDATVELETGQLRKQPDWSFDAETSGKTPVDRLQRPR
jgi:NADH-quinone oxidoreductase subunit F